MTKEQIGIVAHVAQILTAIIAACAWARFELSAWWKMKSLEFYLKNEKRYAGSRTREDRGQRSILHLMARLRLTESEILQASFKSRHIRRILTSDEATRLAKDILIEYDARGNSK
jgi:hypothetical protein